MPASGAHVLLHLRSPAIVGTPEQRSRAVSTPGQDFVVDVVAQKTIVLTILVEVYDVQTSAIGIIDRIQSRLYRPWTLGQLREVNVSVQRVDGANDLPTKYDDRVVSAAQFDVRLGWGTTDAADDFEPADGSTFIERAIVEGDPGGELVIDSTLPL
jgi:hypothetical protein